MSESQPFPIHRLFNDPEADVVFQSADGVRFHLQRKHIEVNTGAFPSAEFETRGEITHLTETSDVLEILFQFVYPRRHPDLDGMNFATVAAVAEAAEKYEVFNAMNICCIRMRQFIPSNASGVLAYALRHDYPKIIPEAALSLVRLPMSVVLRQLPSAYSEPWARYHEAWNSCFEVALKKVMEMRPHQFDFRKNRTCHACLFTMFTIIKDLQSIQPLQDLNVALAEPRKNLGCLSPSSCPYPAVMTDLCADILVKTKAIPSFSTFLSTT